MEVKNKVHHASLYLCSMLFSAEQGFSEVGQLLLADCQGDGVSEQQQSDPQGPGSKELHVSKTALVTYIHTHVHCLYCVDKISSDHATIEVQISAVNALFDLKYCILLFKKRFAAFASLSAGPYAQENLFK